MKKQELSWKAGGQQGEGLESLGEIFAAALCSLGYDVYGYRQFSSRIKGGHTSYKLRIANHPVATIASSCNLLIAMDPDTLEVDAPELTAEGILVTDAAWLEGKKPKVRTVALSWNELSKADGKTLPKNILALGITAALLGIDTAKLLPLLEKQYGRKGAEVMQTNHWKQATNILKIIIMICWQPLRCRSWKIHSRSCLCWAMKQSLWGL